MSKILTISIAAYYVEKYLPECLDSFSYDELAEKLEVLIINDGSGEGVNRIARQYEEKYPQIFRLIDKENGGHGSTVNRGIEEATGKYFKVVDGDDRVTKDGFFDLIHYLENTEDDLVVTDYRWFDDTTGEFYNTIETPFAGKQFSHTYSFDEVCQYVHINMHAATFRTEILKNMGKRLDEHCFYVDAEYIMYPVPFLEKISFLEKKVYEYRQGMSTQSMDIRNMQKNCAHHEKVLKHVLEYYGEVKETLSKEKREYMAKGAARILVSQIKIYLSYPAGKENKAKIKELDKRIQKEYPEVYKHTKNSAVKMLRLSGYTLYPVASFACRKAYHC